MVKPGPIQRAILDRMAGSTTLFTIRRSAPFALDAMNDDGVVLLGAGGHIRASLSWECIEGVGGFLRGQDWVRVAGVHGPGEQGRLHDYLVGYVNRATANWVAALLEEAGVVEVDRGKPLRVRLKPGF